MIQLDPPIGVIEDALFGPSETDPSPDRDADDVPAGQAPADYGMPNSLRAVVDQVLAADRAYAGLLPASGQIRLLHAMPQGRRLSRPLAVFLDHREGSGLWSGWMAGPEADYAGDTDLVLDDRDGPYDPIASMIQVWNPVRALVPAKSAVAAVLNAEKLAVLRAIQSELAEGSSRGQARPGLIAARDFAGHLIALTGTALAPFGDPRTEYRDLYRRVARELSEASERAAAATRKRDGIWGWLTSPVVVGVFATLALVQAGVISLLLSGRPQEAALYRSVPPAPPGAQLRVLFDPNVAQRELQLALRELGAQIIAGPDENGAYILLLPQSVTAAQARDRLRQVPGLVDSVEEWNEPGR